MNRAILKKKISLLFLTLVLSLGAFSQVTVNSLKLPEIPGYQLLKCDFHMHTVFSDGMVWPTTRVNEAFKEGLDAIAITDHIEYRPKVEEFTSRDHQHSYDLAKKTADELGIMLIKATEITRKTPPGHFNAIFIKDANIFDRFVNKEDSRNGDNIVETLTEAKNQGAFIFWNHPWFQHPEDRSEWQAIHEELFSKGLFSGIEVANGGRFDPLVLGWSMAKNLTVMANTDSHAPVVLNNGEFRTMTLVFAKEKSENGIREALNAGRTLAYQNGNLYGREELLSMLVSGSLVITAKKAGERNVSLTIGNISGIPFQVELADDSAIGKKFRSSLRARTLEALSENVIGINGSGIEPGKEYPVKVRILNGLTDKEKPLELELKFRI